MTGLPAGWAVATIDQLIGVDGLFVDGDWVESKDQDPAGEVRLTQLADIGDGQWRNRSDRHLTAAAAERLRCTDLQADDVLVARMPDPLGRACLFPGDLKRCVTVVDVAIIRPGHRSVDPRWLLHTINAPQVRTAIESLQSGTTRKRISRKNLGTVEVAVAPLTEQRRIVGAIEEAFSKLAVGESGLRTVRQSLRRMRDSILNAATTGVLVAQDPAEESVGELRVELGADSLGQIDLPDVPAGWAWVPLGSVTEVQGGIQKQPKRVPASNPVPFLRVANVGRGEIDLSEIHEIEVFDGELDRYRLAAGDLLVVEGNGSPDQIGRSAMWRAAIEPCVHQNHLIRVRPNQVLDPSFLEMYWNSPFASRRVQAVASSTSGLHTLSTRKLRALPVVLPPLEEQRRIVAEVERQMSFIEACERSVEAGLDCAAALRRSVLKAAFEGRLVPQDPSDEPASVLLEQIRAERAAAPPAKRRRAKATP